MILTSNILHSIVCAIWITEGGSNATYPYGIRSIKTNNPEHVCEITVQNNFKRFCAAGGGSEHQFILFLADRYCPVISDAKGNKNWKKNMVKLLKLN